MSTSRRPLALSFASLLLLAFAPACIAEFHDDGDGWGDEEWKDDPNCAGCSATRRDAGTGTPDSGTVACPDDADEAVLYVSREQKVCEGVSFTCPADKIRFDSPCGCGCFVPPPVCPDPNDPLVHYLGDDPSICAQIQFTCADGCDRFDNACGCGCLEPEAPACPDPASARVHYFSQDPAICAQITFTCADGCDSFNDECGCGCLEP